MAIAATVEKFLKDNGIDYGIVSHDHTSSSLQTARAAHVPAAQIAKAVLLEDGDDYLLAVIPASCQVQLGDLRHQLDRPVRMAEEELVGKVFSDCAPGAVPALGPAYGLETILDERLTQQPEIYFESGDHEHLLRLAAGDFVALLRGSRSASFSTPIHDHRP